MPCAGQIDNLDKPPLAALTGDTYILSKLVEDCNEVSYYSHKILCSIVIDETPKSTWAITKQA